MVFAVIADHDAPSAFVEYLKPKVSVVPGKTFLLGDLGDRLQGFDNIFPGVGVLLLLGLSRVQLMPVSDRTNSNSVVREPDNKGACLPACLLAVPLGGGGGRTHLVAPPRSDVVPATNSLTLARLQHRLGLVCSLEVFNVFGPGIFEPLRVQRERESAADDFSAALVVNVEFDGLLSAAARLGGGGRGRAEDLDFGWRPPSLADPNSTSFCCCCERARSSSALVHTSPASAANVARTVVGFMMARFTGCVRCRDEACCSVFSSISFCPGQGGKLRVFILFHVLSTCSITTYTLAMWW